MFRYLKQDFFKKFNMILLLLQRIRRFESYMMDESRQEPNTERGGRRNANTPLPP